MILGPGALAESHDPVRAVHFNHASEAVAASPMHETAPSSQLSYVPIFASIFRGSGKAATASSPLCEPMARLGSEIKQNLVTAGRGVGRKSSGPVTDPRWKQVMDPVEAVQLATARTSPATRSQTGGWSWDQPHRPRPSRMKEGEPSGWGPRQRLRDMSRFTGNGHSRSSRKGPKARYYFENHGVPSPPVFAGAWDQDPPVPLPIPVTSSFTPRWGC